MAGSPLFPGSWEADSRSERRALPSVFSAAFTRVLYLDRLYLQYTCFRFVILEAGMETGQSRSSPCEPHVWKGLRLSAVEGSHYRLLCFLVRCGKKTERVDVEGTWRGTQGSFPPTVCAHQSTWYPEKGETPGRVKVPR